MRCGVNPTSTNLVAFKRRRIRTRDPKSPGKPQQSRGAEVLFQGIFPLARIRARSRGEAAELFRNILNPKRQGVPGPIWQEGFIYSPATGERRGPARQVAPRRPRPRPLVAKQWVAGPAAWRSRGSVRTGRGSSGMLDRDERSTSASRASRWAGPRELRRCSPPAGWVTFVPFGLGWARRATRRRGESAVRCRVPFSPPELW